MEALLVASGALLVAQYKRNPANFRLFLGNQDEDAADKDPFGCDLNKEYPNPTDPCFQDDRGCRVNQVYLDPRDKCYDKDRRRINQMQENQEIPDDAKSKIALGPGEYNFYPDDFFYNQVPKGPASAMPFPTRPAPKYPGRSPLPGVINPVQVDMMNDIRTGNDRIPASFPIASAYRPSWVRNVADNDPLPRQERVREWSTETPREPGDLKQDVNQRYARHGVATLNEFGKGGLPFDDQIRVRPDGLDPDPTRRLPTTRFNKYALGDDLTQSMGDYGKVPGLAQGQRLEGPGIRQEAWDVMPDRDIQLQPSNAPIPLSGAGVRSTGRGAPLGSFLGSAIPQTPAIRQGIEWDAGPTGNKGFVPKLPVRPQDDPLDKRFVHEDIDPTNAQTGVSRKPTLPKGSTSRVGENGAWRFSFDLKQLFDMNLPATSKNRDEQIVSKDDPRQNILELNANKQVQRIALSDAASKNDRPETVEEKVVVLSENARGFVQKGTAESKRRNVNIQPKAAKAGLFGATTYKSETTSTETTVSSSDIGVAKKISTEKAAPLGDQASGRRVAFELSDAPIKQAAINDVASYDNDKIFERGGLMREPMLPAKPDTPDYAQSKIGSMRNGREFRRR